MYKINPGDVWFLKAPFKCNVSKEREKKLAYAIGAISARPVLVMRGPKSFDRFGTVTVIPSLTTGNASMAINTHDLYGNPNNTVCFNFTPHMPYTVSVNRLDRYLGRLEDKEFEEIKDAFRYIMGLDDKYYDREDIPEIYDIPDYSHSIRPEPDVSILIDENNQVHSNDDELDNIIIQMNDAKLAPKKKPVITYEPVTDNNETTIRKVEVIKDSNPKPASRFYDNDLAKAYSYHIPKEYNDPNYMAEYMDIYYDFDDEKYLMRNCSKSAVEHAFRIYSELKPVDVFVYAPRMTAKVLQDILSISAYNAMTLKKVLMFQHNMVINHDERQKRIKSFMNCKAYRYNHKTKSIEIKRDEEVKELIEFEVPQETKEEENKEEKKVTEISTVYEADDLQERTKNFVDRMNAVTEEILVKNNKTDVTQITHKEIDESLDKIKECFNEFITPLAPQIAKHEVRKLKPFLHASGMEGIPEDMYETFLRIPKKTIHQHYSGKDFNRTYTNAYNKIKAEYCNKIAIGIGLAVRVIGCTDTEMIAEAI